MKKSYVYKSVALHIAVVLLCVFDIPFLTHKRDFDEQPPIIVDLENIKIQAIKTAGSASGLFAAQSGYYSYISRCLMFIR